MVSPGNILITPAAPATALPSAIVRVFGEVRFHADGDLLAVAFAPDGSLWSVDEPGVLRQWDSAGQEQREQFLSDLETLWTFSPGARLLVSASDDLSLWDVATGRLLRTVAQPSWVTALAFRGDGRWLASGHDDGIVRLWDMSRGRLVREFAFHERPISALALNTDGTRLASAAEDKVICLWDIESDQPLATAAGHTDRVQALAWQPHGHLLVSAGWDTTARVWDVTLKQVLLLNYHAPQVLALAFSPDGRLLASADSQEIIHVWDFAAAKLRHRLAGPPGPVLCLAFSGDGQRLASAGAAAVIQVSDLRNDEQASPVAGHPTAEGQRSRRNTSLALSRDGSRLASTEGAFVNIWDISLGRRLHQLELPVPACSLAHSPDGRWIAAGGEDAGVRVWDTGKPESPMVLEHNTQTEPVTALAFAPDSQTLAAASATSLAVWLWEVVRGEPTLLIPDALDGCTVEALAFHPQGRLLAVGGVDWLATGGSDGAVSLWDLQDRCEVATFPGGTRSVAFHPLGRLLAATSLAGSICLWDHTTQELLAEWIAGEGNLACVAFHPDGSVLASGGEDRAVQLWEFPTGKLLRQTELNTQVQTLAFSPDGRFLFTGNSNRTCYQIEVARLGAPD
jgi:WD40 repeat protein